jgi:hypothetical protein
MSEDVSLPERSNVFRLVPRAEPEPDEPEVAPSPVAMLEAVLAQVKSGAIDVRMMIVHCVHAPPAKSYAQHAYWEWNVSPLEHLGLLELGKHSLLTVDK